MKATISRKGHFSAAHRLYNVHWDRNKNIEEFGKCAYVNYHGHNYKYIVSITGEIDPKTGFVFSIQKLKNLIHEEIDILFDHKNINVDIEKFYDVNPTTENIVVFLWNQIKKKISSNLDLKITLYETENNFAEYDGS